VRGSVRTALLLLSAFALLASGTTSALPEPGPELGARLAVTLTAQPTSGVIPLLVTLQAHPSSGSATFYNWSFGDGTFLNGTSVDANLSHQFDRAGTFNVTVRVVGGNQTGLAWTLIQAISGPLQIVAQAAPSVGSAPLTVHLSATVSGGTETYLSFSWTFGDGGVGSGISVSYTYATRGTYLCQVRVIDSAQDVATSSLWVNVSSAGAGAAPPWYATLASPVGELALSVGMGGVALLLLRRLTRPRAGASAGGSAQLPWAVPPGVMGVTAAEDPATSETPEIRSSAARPTGEVLRNSERVLVHLLVQGRSSMDAAASSSITQAGIGEALSLPQNSLTHILARLKGGGLIVEERRHVVGRGRRLKTYQLTPRGEALARALWPRIRGERIGPSELERSGR
jgi:PKD repeat protein/DNA-binding MarR family transcriptional regulator